jgi:hydroxyacylglutathione hydrolase
MNPIALPAFNDNYIWLLHDGARAVVVDPGDAAPVLATLDAQGLQLAGILVTHHHADHVGGIAALMPRLSGRVWAPADEPLEQAHEAAHDGDTIDLLGLRIAVLAVPGHTAGHVAYVCNGAGQAPLLFCGDTLFSAGCGRVFEGTPAQMLASLMRLAALPADTRVCCAHEYTLSNLRFAAQVEPGNAARAAYEERCRALRVAELATLPSSIGLELQINPFLRCTQPEVVAAARAHGAPDDTPLAVFTALRQWKNRT